MSTTPPVLWQTFKCHDAHAMIDVLVSIFGFDQAIVHAEGDVVHHAELRWPEGGGVMLGSKQPGAWEREPGTAGTYIQTEHVDEIHARCVDAGLRIIEPLHDTDYGSHTFAVADPEGNYWSFGTYPGEPYSG